MKNLERNLKIRGGAMNSKKSKKNLKGLAFATCLSMILTIFPSVVRPAVLEKPPANGFVADDCAPYISFGAIICPNRIIDLDGLFLLSEKKDKKTEKTTKDRVKDHTNSTSRKPANGDD